MVSARIYNRNKNKINFNSDFPILILEDDIPFAEKLSANLNKELESSVKIVSNFDDAQELLNNNNFSFMVCNFDLCTKNPDLTNSILKFSKIPFCLTSYDFDDEQRGLVFRLGAIDYFVKKDTNCLIDILSLIKRINRNSEATVLLVDDNPLQRIFFAHQLKRLNLNVVEAEDGDDALIKLNENKKISLVLTDFLMPNLDGIALSAKIRAIYPKDEMAILGISAEDDPRLVTKFIKNGANDCLRKNILHEEFSCKINQTLEILEITKSHKESATKDFLTGLHNRRHFFTEGLKTYKKNKDNLNEISLALIDIDFFKMVNDTYGHDAGDEVLIQLAYLLTEYFEKHIVARVGGEEFAILFNCGEEESYKLLEDFRVLVYKTKIELSDQENLKISISCGLTNGHSPNFDELFNSADKQLYKAKNSGRNKVSA